MKRWRKVLAALVLWMVMIVVLVWFMPAWLAALLLQPKLHGVKLEQTHGTLWEGSADRVLSPTGADWGQLHWSLSHTLLLGKVRAQWSLQQPQLLFEGRFQRLSADAQLWSALHLHANAGLIDTRKWLGGQAQGQLMLQVPQLDTQGNWPMQMNGQASWRDAVLQTPQGNLPLGNLQLAANTQAGVSALQLHDDGHGPLAVNGDAAISPLGWRLDLSLRPRNDNPALRNWLTRFGQPGPDGTVQVRYRGGLASLH